MNRIITYTDFENITNFAKLILWFQAQDDRNPPEIDNLVDAQKLVEITCKNDFKITYKSGMKNYDDLYFFKDFLIPRVEKVEPSKNYANYINEKIEQDLKYKIPERGLFIKDEINKLKNLLDKVQQEPYVNIHYSKSLNDQIEQSIEMLYNDDSLFEEKDNSQKIKVKLLRSELTCLFYLLRQAGYIDHKYDNDLGKLLENSFLYYNQKDESYSELKDINKVLSGFKNGDKPMTTAAESLKEILSNPDFYKNKY